MDLTTSEALRDVPVGARVVVGVSGGVDSTVLLRLLVAARFEVTAAHLNYGLRGEASEGDEAFVRALADELGVPVRVRAEGLPEGGGVQARARALRFAFFGDVGAEVGASLVAIGTNRDDQAETVLLHLFRGTGPRGLAGAPAVRALAPGSDVRLVRPLLGYSRREIEALARANGWLWREDASNADLSYRRNRLRHEILPLLETHFGPGVASRIADAAALVRAFLDGETSAPGDETAGGGTLPLDALRALPDAARTAVLLDALRRFVPGAPVRRSLAHRLDALIASQPGRRLVLAGGVVWRDRDRLVFQQTTDTPDPDAGPLADAVPIVPGGRTTTPWGVLDGTLVDEPAFDLVRAPEAAGPFVEVVDADALDGPLVLRPWRAGDRFRPFGMDGTKAVGDLLTERRVPPSERAGALVLTAGEGVVWVVGHRIAHGVRLTPATRRALRLAWTPREGTALSGEAALDESASAVEPGEGRP